MKERLSAKDTAVRVGIALGFLTTAGGCVLPQPNQETAPTIEPATSVPTGIPTDFEVTPTGGVTPIFEPTEVVDPCPLSPDGQAELLFKEGISGYGSAPLVTMEGIKSVYGEVLAPEIAVEIENSIDAMLTWLPQSGIISLAIPQFAEKLTEKYQNNSEITLKVIDAKDGVIGETPEGFVAIEAKAFEKGGWGVFVKGKDGLTKVILPKGEKLLGNWLIEPANDVDIYTLPGQALYGNIQVVKVAENCSWSLVQQDKEGNVVAAADMTASVDDKDNIWKVNTELATKIETGEYYSDFNTEGVTCRTKEDCLNGLLDIDQEGGKTYYRGIVENLLKSEVNDNFFRQKFGITNFDDPVSIEKTIVTLKEKYNYIMPEGLMLPFDSYIKAFRGQLLPEFKFDTVLVSIWDQSTYFKNAYQTPKEDINYFSKDQRAIADDRGVIILGQRLLICADGQQRLNLIIASAENDPKIPNGPSVASASEDLTSNNTQKIQSGLQTINRFISFYPHLYLNQKNYLHDPQSEIISLFAPDYFWNRKGLSIIEGDYRAYSGEAPYNVFDK